MFFFFFFNNLDPDQSRRDVGPDLNLNFLSLLFFVCFLLKNHAKNLSMESVLLSLMAQYQPHLQRI